jgi:surface antigen
LQPFKARLRGLIAVLLIAAAMAACGGTLTFAVLDRVDRDRLADALQLALEKNRTGEGANWSNPDTGHRGTVVPIRTFKGTGGSDCREFQQTATVSGETDIAFGSACRTTDGAWRIVDAPSRYHPRYTDHNTAYDHYFGYYGYPYYPYGYRRRHRY